MYLLQCTYCNVNCKLSVLIKTSSHERVVLIYLETLGERMNGVYTYSLYISFFFSCNISLVTLELVYGRFKKTIKIHKDI